MFMRFLLILFLFVSCSKQVNVKQANGIFYISDFDLSIGDARPIKWKVGLKREAVVSQGLLMRLDVPHMKDSDSNKLGRANSIDSWIYRLSRKRNNRAEILGYIELPFNKINSTTDDFTIQILYAAAIPSADFRRFHCPAFQHRKRIADIKNLKSSNSNFTLYVNQNEILNASPAGLEFINISFNGGTSLQGEYYGEIALYNRHNKMIYGKFTRLNGSVLISSEEEVKVQSCVGIREEVYPLPGSRKSRIQDLEIR